MSMPRNCQITKTKELGIVPRMHALFPCWIIIEIAYVIPKESSIIQKIVIYSICIFHLYSPKRYQEKFTFFKKLVTLIEFFTRWCFKKN